MNTHKPFVISVEGIISAGKTCFIKECLIPMWASQGVKARIIKEPVDKWGDILPLFYEDPKRWAYHFQSKAFHDRVMESKYMWDTYKDDTDIFICDRSIFSDPQFMEINHQLGNVTDLELQHYQEWWNMWSTVMPFTPNLFIYLEPTIEKAMERCKLRARNGETRVTPEYQQLLKISHDNKFGNTTFTYKNDQIDLTIPVLHVSSRIDYKNNETIKRNVFEFVSGYITAMERESIEK